MKHFLLFILFFLLATLIYPQPNQWASYFSQQGVNALRSEGRFIWAGTKRGIIKLDKITGEREFFQKSNSGLPCENVREIVIDSKGNKWIATDSGLVKFDGINWTPYHSPYLDAPYRDAPGGNTIRQSILAMTIDGQDNLWLSGENGSLLKFDGTNWTMYREKDYGVQDTVFTCIAADKNGSMWIGSKGSGLFRFDGLNWTNFNMSNSPLPKDFVTSLAVDPNGTLWVGTIHGFAKFDGVNWAAYSQIDGLYMIEPASITIDKNGIVWFGLYGEGLLKYDGQTFTVINKSNSDLPGNDVVRILSDPDGTKWMGTNFNSGSADQGEILKYDDKNWTIYKTSNSGLPADVLQCIAVDSLNNKWIGTGNYIVKYDGINWTVFNSSDLNADLGPLIFLAVGPNGNVWAKYDHKLLKYDGKAWALLEGSVPGLPEGTANFDDVSSISFDLQGNIWMGILNYGLLKYDGAKWNLFSSSNSGLPNNLVAYLACDQNGNLLAVLYDEWARKDLKVVKFDGSKWTTFNCPLDLRTGAFTGPITGLNFDLKGNVYVASSIFGLLRFDGQNWTLYNSDNSGLATYGINSVALDKSGNLWISSAAGFQKFDGVNWTPYGSGNGLSGGYNPVRSHAFDRQGNMWLATEQGLHVYREEGLILSAGMKNGKRDLPGSFCLEQNYPNPFNPSTKISYSIPEGRLVKLTVYDILGREITALVNEYKPKGSYIVEYNAGHLPSGVYIYTIQAGEFSYSKKLVLLR